MKDQIKRRQRARATRAYFARVQAAADRYHAESRAEIATRVAKGEGEKVLAEMVGLLGIDLAKGERPRLVGFGGTTFK